MARVEHMMRTAAPGGGSASGAIAVIDLIAPDETALAEALARLALPVVRIGQARLARLGGAEQVVIARWSGRCASLTAHAGPAALRGALETLGRAGIEPADRDGFDARRWPEARDEVEARALQALAHAASPRAIDLLLDQPRRWRERLKAPFPGAEIEAHSRALGRLLRPPVVAAVGASNIGKSALLNALAGRGVSIEADEPGTTRDRVGATIELDGLVVLWVDTPGARETEDEVELAARLASRGAIAMADLVVHCADARSGFLTARELEELGAGSAREALRVGLRDDLGPTPGASVSTSAATGAGLATLAQAVRERLVPDEALAWPGPWRFDAALPL